MNILPISKKFLEFKTIKTDLNSSVEKYEISMTANDYENGFYPDIGEATFYIFKNGRLDLDILKNELNLECFKKLRSDKNIIGNGPILLISNVRIYSKYRNRGFGGLLVNHILENYEGNVLLQAMPYEADKEKIEDFVNSFDKLMKFYTSLGFDTYPKSKNFLIENNKFMIYKGFETEREEQMAA